MQTEAFDDDFIRYDIRQLVNAHARKTGLTHSQVFRLLYLQLELATGFRPPAKNGLKAVASNGYLQQLHQQASKLVEGSKDKIVDASLQPVEASLDDESEIWHQCATT